MSQSVQNDVKEGARSRWLLTPELLARVPAASLYSGKVLNEPAPPYATLAVEFIEKQEVSPASPGTPYVDRVRLTVSLWAAGADATTGEDAAGDLVGLVLAAFGDETWTVPDSLLMAAIPEAEASVQEDGTRQGQPVWRADVAFELWLRRYKAAAPALYRLLDHFAGAGSLAAHPMNVGAGWTLRTGTWALLDGEVTPESINHVLATAEAGYADGVLTAAITFAANSAAGVVVRYADASNYWRVYASQSTSQLNVTKVEAGVASTVAFGAVPAFGAGEHTLAVTLAGTTISATFDGGAAVATSVATLNSTATVHGLYALSPVGATYGDFQFAG